MWETGKSILLSRTVWVAFGGVVIAIANLLGYPIGNEQVSQIIDMILFVLAAVFRVMATRTVHVLPQADKGSPSP